MLNVTPHFIKYLIILVQILSLSLYPQAGLATPKNSYSDKIQQQLILTTAPLKTQGLSTHIEVQTFEINNEQDLAQAQNALLEKTKKDSDTKELFILDVATTEHKATDLDISAKKALHEIENTISSQNKIEAKPIIINAPDKNGFFKRHYNVTLAMVRFVANSATVATGLIIGKGVPIEHALLVGVLAGAVSGAIQLKSEAYLKWLTNSMFLVKTAKKMGFLSDNDGSYIGRGEKTLKEIETYGKWGAVEVAFLLVCQTSMSLLNIPITENLFLTAAKSTLSQGVFEIGVSKSTEQLEKMNPSWSKKAAVFRDISLFGGSSLSVLAAIGAMAGIPFANLAFVALTATGLVLNFAPRLIRLKPIEKILNRWHHASSVISCRVLFE